MDSFQIAQVAAQANAIGNEHGVTCLYIQDGGKFFWVFYRRTGFARVRLGKTSDPKKVVSKMERYCKCTH